MKAAALQIMPTIAWTPSDFHCVSVLMSISQWCQVKGAELCMILH